MKKLISIALIFTHGFIQANNCVISVKKHHGQIAKNINVENRRECEKILALTRAIITEKNNLAGEPKLDYFEEQQTDASATQKAIAAEAHRPAQ